MFLHMWSYIKFREKNNLQINSVRIQCKTFKLSRIKRLNYTNTRHARRYKVERLNEILSLNILAIYVSEIVFLSVFDILVRGLF